MTCGRAHMVRMRQLPRAAASHSAELVRGWFFADRRPLIRPFGARSPVVPEARLRHDGEKGPIPRRKLMAHRRSEKSTGPSQRQLRVGEVIRHALAEMLARGEIHDEVLATHVVTVPEVRMSPDLRLATVYVMPLGGADVKPVLAALERNRRFIRGEIAHAVNLKFAPDVRFLADETFDEARRNDEILRSPKVARDLGKG